MLSKKVGTGGAWAAVILEVFPGVAMVSFGPCLLECGQIISICLPKHVLQVHWSFRSNECHVYISGFEVEAGTSVLRYAFLHCKHTHRVIEDQVNPPIMGRDCAGCPLGGQRLTSPLHFCLSS